MELIPRWLEKLPRSLKSGDPFNVDKIFEDFEGVFKSHSGLNISSDDQNIYIEAHVPGLSAKDVEVSIDKDNVLWIRGKKQEEEKDKQKRIYRQSQSSFSYYIPLWDEIDLKVEPKAGCKDGVMKITFAKKKENQGQVRKIEVQPE